nr:MAG TPA: hypothetical protein [Caudoviricetes sp.]
MWQQWESTFSGASLVGTAPFFIALKTEWRRIKK